MPVEMGMWRIEGDQPRRLGASLLPSEAALEDFLEHDPALLGTRLLVIGRQVRTPYGKFIDLLAMDGEGNLVVLELKRDKTPREVVAQVLDYGSWVTSLTRDAVIEIANDHLDEPFEAAFEDAFGEAPPDELNAETRLTIVATDLDDSSERVVRYLREFGVPINAVFFAHLKDEGRRYLARSWLVSQEERRPSAPKVSGQGKRADWNGLDWYVNFGHDENGRRWEDGMRFGFVAAGGGRWYSQTLRNLPVGARVNVNLPGKGYVAVGITLAEAARFDEARVLVKGEWVRLADLRHELLGNNKRCGEDRDPDDLAEYIVPVRWVQARPVSKAYWEKGMFAKQLSACRLRQQFTLDRLAQHFGLNEASEGD